ncbi:unnamed protein product [Symbiodinium sp. CCMP2592]|nr:unnamed protein product [Symbiodinium sp. CCMP2592]
MSPKTQTNIIELPNAVPLAMGDARRTAEMALAIGAHLGGDWQEFFACLQQRRSFALEKHGAYQTVLPRFSMRSVMESSICTSSAVWAGVCMGAFSPLLATTRHVSQGLPTCFCQDIKTSARGRTAVQLNVGSPISPVAS